MSEKITSDTEQTTGVYYAPLEKSFHKILTPFEEFIHRQTTSGLLLMAKIGILFASLVAGIAGFLGLYLVSEPILAKAQH